MSYESTDLYVLDQDDNPIENVVVRLFDAAGVVLTTQGTSDSNGVVSLLLPSGTLTVRCYKFSVEFGSPITIEILEAQNNAFNIYGEVLEPPVASDVRMCTAYGYFRRENGAPAANVDIHFVAKFDPLLVDGAAIMPSRVLVRTDGVGYAQIDLIRYGQYDVNIQGDRDMLREVTVPNLVNVNLPDLLFPVVEKVAFDVATPWAIPIGSTLDVIPTVYLSDGRICEGTALDDVTWSSSDEEVVNIVSSDDMLSLQGLSAGVAEISASRKDYTVIRIPDSPVVGQPVTVTVS